MLSWYAIVWHSSDVRIRRIYHTLFIHQLVGIVLLYELLSGHLPVPSCPPHYEDLNLIDCHECQKLKNFVVVGVSKILLVKYHIWWGRPLESRQSLHKVCTSGPKIPDKGYLTLPSYHIKYLVSGPIPAGPERKKGGLLSPLFGKSSVIWELESHEWHHTPIKDATY